MILSYNLNEDIKCWAGEENSYDVSSLNSYITLMRDLAPKYSLYSLERKNLSLFTNLLNKFEVELNKANDTVKFEFIKKFLTFWVEENDNFPLALLKEFSVWLSKYYDFMLNSPISFIVKEYSLFESLGIKFKNVNFNLIGDEFDNSLGYNSKEKLAISINKEIKFLGIPSIDFNKLHKFIEDIGFSDKELLKIFSGVNLYNLPVSFFNSYSFSLGGGLLDSKFNIGWSVESMIKIANWAIKVNVWSKDLARSYFSEHMRNNIDTLKTSLSNWEGFSYFIDTTDTFWFLYFNFVMELNHDSIRATSNEDVIIENFYSSWILSSGASLRIPSQYNVSISSSIGNIAYSICRYTVSFKSRTMALRAYPIAMFKNLLNIIADNDKVLLEVEMSYRYDEKKNLFKFINSQKYDFCFPEEYNPSKKFLFFRKKVYVKKGNDFISFLPMENTIAVHKDESKEVKVVENNQSCHDVSILSAWGVDSTLLNPSEIGAISNLANLVLNVRNFLKNFKSIDEDVYFLEDRVDVYAKDLIETYQNGLKLNKEIRALSSISLNNSPDFIKNLGILHKHVQYCVDKVVKDYQDVQNFENQKMRVFLEDRFHQPM